jgi:hypothetical protein
MWWFPGVGEMCPLFIIFRWKGIGRGRKKGGFEFHQVLAAEGANPHWASWHRLIAGRNNATPKTKNGQNDILRSTVTVRIFSILQDGVVPSTVSTLLLLSTCIQHNAKTSFFGAANSIKELYLQPYMEYLTVQELRARPMLTVLRSAHIHIQVHEVLCI